MKVLSVLLLLFLGVFADTENNEVSSELEISTISKPDDCDKVSKRGDMLTMHYRGTLDDGTEFDSRSVFLDQDTIEWNGFC